MTQQRNGLSRREFFAGAATAAAAAVIPSAKVFAEKTENKILQVWSCGGLAEAFMPANERYSEMTGIEVAYTGAFAAGIMRASMKTDQGLPTTSSVLKRHWSVLIEP